MKTLLILIAVAIFVIAGYLAGVFYRLKKSKKSDEVKQRYLRIFF